MYRIQYETTAIADFEAIRSYFLEKENATTIADQIIGNIIKRANDLKAMPKMYRQSEHCPDFRLFSESGYLVHYLINDETKTIEVHYIWHGMRNISQLLQEASSCPHGSPS